MATAATVVAEEVKTDAKAFAVDDPEGLLKWPAPDRALFSVASMVELKAHEDAVVRIVRQRIALL